MIRETLGHLTDDGLICMHFGEYHFATKPNRTMRYLATARAAFTEDGITSFSRHALVATSPSLLEVSTMLLKKSPFTPSETERFLAVGHEVPGTVPRYVPGIVLTWTSGCERSSSCRRTDWQSGRLRIRTR